MRIDDGYGSMMQMPFGHVGIWILVAVFVLLVLGFGIGYAVGRAR